MNIDEWLAKECGVAIEQDTHQNCEDLYLWQEEQAPAIFWDYKDPRCMAVIRAHFNIETTRQHHINSLDWIAQTTVDKNGYNFIKCGEDNTPHEADCKCVEAIWENADEQR